MSHFMKLKTTVRKRHDQRIEGLLKFFIRYNKKVFPALVELHYNVKFSAKN